MNIFQGLPHHSKSSDPTVVKPDGLPNGLPAAVKQVIAQERAATAVAQSGETEAQRIERQTREHYIDLYYRQGGGNGTRGK